MNLKQLEFAVALAEEGNFTRAALALAGAPAPHPLTCRIVQDAPVADR